MGEFLNKTYKKPSEVAEENLKVRNLTKREYFAAMAMQGFISLPALDARNSTFQDIAICAVKQADALLTELERTNA